VYRLFLALAYTFTTKRVWELLMKRILHRVPSCVHGHGGGPLDALEIILPHLLCQEMVNVIDETKTRHRAIKELMGRSKRVGKLKGWDVTFSVEFPKEREHGDLLIIEYRPGDLLDGKHSVGSYSLIIDEAKSSPMGTVTLVSENEDICCW
jgi:hypothetical protein